MDFNHVWINPARNVSPNVFNNYSHAPPPYSDRSYTVRSGPSSLVNLPCCDSPVCSISENFFPEPCATRHINQNVRYHPYQPPFSPLKERDLRKRETSSFYSEGAFYNSEMKKEEFFISQMNCPQNVKIYPQMNQEKYPERNNHFKSNVKRKRQNSSRNRRSLARGNIPKKTINNNPQNNWDTNVSFDCIRNKKDSVKHEEKNIPNKVSVANEQNYTTGTNYSNATIMGTNVNNTVNYINDSHTTDKLNFPPCVVKDAGFIPEYKNDPLLSNLNNGHEDITTNSIFENPTSTDANSLQSLDNVDLPNCQVTHITMPENTTFNIQDVQQEDIQKLDLEKYFFEPIFEGKDENGEDIVILFSNSNAEQTITVENIPDKIVDNPSVAMQNDQAGLKFVEKDTTIANEASLEVQNAVNQLGEIIFSNADDYASEEIVTTSKRKYNKNNKTNKKNDKISYQNCSASINQAVKDGYSINEFTAQPGTSTENKNTSTDTSQNENSSGKKYKRINVYSRQRIPAWRRRLLWKSNDPLKNIQRTYFKKFMKRVKLENKHVNEEFWNMYKIVVTRIGGNILQTMYNILPQLIKNSGGAKHKAYETNASKLNKKRLQVKFPAKVKKT